MTVSHRLQHQLKEQQVGQIMHAETPWTKYTHSKFDVLNYTRPIHRKTNEITHCTAVKVIFHSYYMFPRKSCYGGTKRQSWWDKRYNWWDINCPTSYTVKICPDVRTTCPSTFLLLLSLMTV